MDYGRLCQRQPSSTNYGTLLAIQTMSSGATLGQKMGYSALCLAAVSAKIMITPADPGDVFTETLLCIELLGLGLCVTLICFPPLFPIKRYQRSLSQKGRLVLSPPYEDLLSGENVLTLSQTVYEGRSAIRVLDFNLLTSSIGHTRVSVKYT